MWKRSRRVWRATSGGVTADGRYGRCLVDGGPIGTKRLDAVPWAPYCIKHQRLLEAASRSKLHPLGVLRVSRQRALSRAAP